MNIEEIAKEKLNEWIQLLLTKDPEKMISLYHNDAILLPTLAANINNSPEKIKNYFVSFLAKGPQCQLYEHHIVKLSDTSVFVAGHYNFSFEDQSSANARFSYIFSKKNSTWKIIHHHSSLQP